MKNNNNKVNKAIRLLMRSKYSLGNKSSRGKRSTIGVANYQRITRFCTFGPGSYRLRVTKLFTGRLDVQQEVNVYNDILATNPELGRVIGDFKYILCEGIFVTFSARNLSGDGNLTPAYLMLNYDGVSTENIRLQDNVKTIPPFLSQDKTFKYKMPRLNVYGGLLNGWFKLENLASYADLVFQLYAPSNTSNWYIRFDIQVKLRGPTNVTAKQVSVFGEKKSNILDNQEEEHKEIAEELLKKDEQATYTLEKTPESAKEVIGTSNVSYKENTGGMCKSLQPNELMMENQTGFMLVPCNKIRSELTDEENE